MLLLWRPSPRTGDPSAAAADARRQTPALPGSGQPAGAKAASTPWPSFWNPWTGSIQMWPGPQPPLAPLPPRPQQQQELLAQQLQQVQHQPQAAAPVQDTTDQWAPPGVLPSHRRDALIGFAAPRLYLQHHDTELAAAKQRVVLRLRCYLSHGLSFRHSFT